MRYPNMTEPPSCSMCDFSGEEGLDGVLPSTFPLEKRRVASFLTGADVNRRCKTRMTTESKAAYTGIARELRNILESRPLEKGLERGLLLWYVLRIIERKCCVCSKPTVVEKDDSCWVHHWDGKATHELCHSHGKVGVWKLTSMRMCAGRFLNSETSSTSISRWNYDRLVKREIF